MYKTETHVHTSEVSICAKVPAARMVKFYYEAGYRTIFITDHLGAFLFDRLGQIPWRDKITIYLEGYFMAKEFGEKLGMNVLLGAEITFRNMPNDYLLYGIDREFLNALEEYPDIFSLGIEKFSEFARKHNVFIVQAHPYRDGMCFPTPDFVDGLEVLNSNPRHMDNSEDSLKVAKKHDLYMTAGSDAHREEDVGRTGILTECEIKTAADFIECIKSGKAQIIKIDSDEVYD